MPCAASVVVVHALAKTETRQAPVHHRWGWFVSVCLFVCLSVCLSVCLFVCLCLSVCVSVCLSCRGRGVDPVVGEPPGIPEDPWSCLFKSGAIPGLDAWLSVEFVQSSAIFDNIEDSGYRPSIVCRVVEIEEEVEALYRG